MAYKSVGKFTILDQWDSGQNDIWVKCDIPNDRCFARYTWCSVTLSVRGPIISMSNAKKDSLEEARIAFKAKDYEVALERYQFFFEHALDNDPHHRMVLGCHTVWKNGAI